MRTPRTPRAPRVTRTPVADRIKQKVAAATAKIPTAESINKKVATATARIPTAESIKQRVDTATAGRNIAPQTSPKYMVEGKMVDVDQMEKMIRAKATMRAKR